MAPPTEPRPRPHFALFDGLRALAALAVVATHVGSLSGANMRAWYGVATSHLNIGVTVFFLISGFLLYTPYAQAIAHAGSRPSLPAYARRRVLRIGPAYWTALTVLAVWPGLPDVFTSRWWVYYGLAQAYFPSLVFNGISATWSLTAEVGFYVMLPVLGWSLWRICRQRAPHDAARLQLLAFAALAVLGETLRHTAGPVFPAVGMTLPGLLLDFSIGMALAVLKAEAGGDDGRWPFTRFVIAHPSVCWLAAAALYVGACFTPAYHRAWAEAYTAGNAAAEHLVNVTFATVLLLPAVFGEAAGGLPRRFLASPPVRFLGTISYGIFLWHYPIMAAMAHAGGARWIAGAPFLSLAIVAVPAAIVCGAGSFYLIERPAMRHRDRQPRANLRPPLDGDSITPRRRAEFG